MRNRVRGIILMSLSGLGWFTMMVQVPNYSWILLPGGKEKAGRVLAIGTACAIAVFSLGVAFYRKGRLEQRKQP